MDRGGKGHAKKTQICEPNYRWKPTYTTNKQKKECNRITERERKKNRLMAIIYYTCNNEW